MPFFLSSTSSGGVSSCSDSDSEDYDGVLACGEENIDLSSLFDSLIVFMVLRLMRFLLLSLFRIVCGVSAGVWLVFFVCTGIRRFYFFVSSLLSQELGVFFCLPFANHAS